MIKRFFFLSFLLVSCSFSQDYSDIRVTEVIDGDTVRLSDGKLLRYIGIDTPEVRIKQKKEFIYSPQPFALEAKELNKRLVQGKRVRVELDVEKTDRYGRLLGYCFVGDVFINSELLKEGFAVLYTYPPNIKYTDELIASQKEARRQKKGLWGSYEVIESGRASGHINQIRTVRGKVLNTFASKKCLLLNFGQDYRTDFTVVIFKNSLASFNSKGINPLEFYRGKTIEVSGRIRSYNGPEIIVNSPQEITVVKEQ
ncbi:MAG: thermonuclease family protein [Candidatus Omnitrophica bacterium]|nr:thermonuclease family protein [Candidatus Omnitrophota bacterium]MDD5429090.1 thermonuclease family protein [Candidatus Omnitrophota bacterium]